MQDNSSLHIYTDGGARGNPGPAAAAFVAVQNGEVVHKDAKFLGEVTNNVAEYEGVLLALNWLVSIVNQLHPETIIFFLDSELVTRQLTGKYKIKNPKMKTLSQKAKDLLGRVDCPVNFVSIPRSKNKKADALLNTKIDENI